MHQERKICDNIFYVGGSDRRLNLFENLYPVENGISYNSYLIMDDKNVLLDTVDKSISRVFFDNLQYLLQNKKLDYVIINHMEPDHAATLEELIIRYPDVTIVGNAKTFNLIEQFFSFPIEKRMLQVKEGDSLNTGKHTFHFYMAPMVHWPEVMVSYEETNKMLFSADAFGIFGALNGNLFSDEVDFQTQYLGEARRYYSNIIGKYGPQTKALLKKLDNLDIKYICPLHGFVWRDTNLISWIIEKYTLWSSYIAEDKEVVIYYASIYGGTEDAATLLANNLADKGIKNIKMFDVSVTPSSYLISEAFRAQTLVFACVSYNASLFPNMEKLILELKGHGLQNRNIAFFENGSWALSANKCINNLLEGMKNINIIDHTFSIKSSLKENQISDIIEMSDAIISNLQK